MWYFPSIISISSTKSVKVVFWFHQAGVKLRKEIGYTHRTDQYNSSNNLPWETNSDTAEGTEVRPLPLKANCNDYDGPMGQWDIPKDS